MRPLNGPLRHGPKDVRDILKKNGINSSDIDHFIPHQANYRIIKAVGDALKMTERQVVLTIQKYGNTSAASIPMAINDIYEAGRAQEGGNYASGYHLVGG